MARAEVAVNAAAESSRFGKSLARVVASRARLRIIRRKPPVEEQSAAECDAFAGERIVARQIRSRRELRNRQPIRRGIWCDLDVIRSACQFCHRRKLAHIFHGKSGFNILPEPDRQRVVCARMRRVAGVAQSDFVWRGENISDIQGHLQFAAGIQVERDGQLNRHQPAVGGEMEGKAAAFAAILPAAFEREKNVFMRPAPIQPVHVGIQRMAGGPFRGVTVIDGRFQSDVKTHAVIISGGNVLQGEIGFAGAQADVTGPIFLPNPNPIRAPQRDAGQKKIQPRDGNGLSAGGLIFQRVKNQRRAVELREKIHAQIRRARAGGQQERDEQREFFQRAVHFS